MLIKVLANCFQASVAWIIDLFVLGERITNYLAFDDVPYLWRQYYVGSVANRCLFCSDED